MFLSVVLGLFLAEAGVSLLDDTLILLLGQDPFAFFRGTLFLGSVLAALLCYLLLGFSPMVPKRYFLPVTLFHPVTALGIIPLAIYHYGRIQQISWGISLIQVIVGLAILWKLQGGFAFRWPLVRPDQLEGRVFSGRLLAWFLAVNVGVLLPGMLAYLAGCASLGLDHFSGGFMALHADRLTTRAKTFVRGDGKSIRLVPMMHIGEPRFYDEIAKAFPTNSVVLLEGVTDTNGLLRHPLSYQRAAHSLGLTEQRDTFAPAQGNARRADIDVAEFSSQTLEVLNLAALFHSQGLTPQTIAAMAQSSQNLQLPQQLWHDLLTKRNEHLLRELRRELNRTDIVVVPWGAAHMPGIALAIQAEGFQPSESQEHTVFYFSTVWERLVAKKK